MSQFLRAGSHCVDAGDDKVFRRRRISPVDGLKSGQFNQERTSEKANIEYRIMNVECRRDVFCLFQKRLSEAKPFIIENWGLVLTSATAYS